MERSQFWSGIATGDAGPYSDDQYNDMAKAMFMYDITTEGPIRGQGNELVVSGVATPVSIATGKAMVDGTYYTSTAIETIAVSTPAGSTRIDRVALEKDFANQTVRLVLVNGIEGGGAATLTQTDGVKWQVSLAQVSITTGGVITVTDERQFITMQGVPKDSVFHIASYTVPSGFSEYTTGRGRYIVGLLSGGTLANTIGTALSDGENRATGQHSHGVTDPGHTHTIPAFDVGGGGTAITASSASITPRTKNTGSSVIGITIDNAGSVAGTNAPYISLLCIKKD